VIREVAGDDVEFAEAHGTHFLDASGQGPFDNARQKARLLPG
jgi:hypothetical protein